MILIKAFGPQDLRVVGKGICQKIRSIYKEQPCKGYSAIWEIYGPSLDEVIPGTGGLDYRTLLKELHQLGPEIPFILEHLTSKEEYQMAAAYIQKNAAEVNVPL